MSRNNSGGGRCNFPPPFPPLLEPLLLTQVCRMIQIRMAYCLRYIQYSTLMGQIPRLHLVLYRLRFTHSSFRLQ
jgi:hypothetical protein